MICPKTNKLLNYLCQGCDQLMCTTCISECYGVNQQAQLCPKTGQPHQGFELDRKHLSHMMLLTIQQILLSKENASRAQSIIENSQKLKSDAYDFVQEVTKQIEQIECKNEVEIKSLTNHERSESLLMDKVSGLGSSINEIVKYLPHMLETMKH